MGIVWKNDPAFPLNAEFLTRPLDCRPGLRDRFLVPNSTGSGVILKANTLLTLKSNGIWKAYLFDQDIEITTLDTGSLTLGMDYYVYLCDDNSDNGLLLISANATAPDGYTVDNSRKIGGFHYGRVRTIDQRYDQTATLAVQVIPNSVWDLFNRPKCPDPSGMVKVGNIWVDIYLSSEDGTPWPDTVPLSLFNAVPLTGTEGYSYLDMARLAVNAGKRLPTYDEFLQFAYGVPEGSTGASARVNTGSVSWMVSCFNVDQPSGNIWQVGRGILDNGDGAYAWTGVDAGKDSSFAQGAIYNDSARQLLLGGFWGSGAYAGARCANLNSAPWDVGTSVGVHCVCDSL